MDALPPIILIAAGVFVGCLIGANDAANCIGTTVGARIMSYRKAVALMSVFVLLGATLQGHRVMETVGHGIVNPEPSAGQSAPAEPAAALLQPHGSQGRLPDKAILAALLSAGLFVGLATMTRIPVSTSQAIVGGVAGAGIGMVGLRPEYFGLEVLARIFSAWVISPILTMLLAFVLYSVLSRLLARAHAVAWSRVLAIMLMVSAAYVSFSLGANDVGNAVGPLLNRYPDHGGWLALLVGTSLALGAMLFGARVSDTVGKQITALDYASAGAAQLAAAVSVHLFSLLAIPVSTSQAIVGGVVGVGLTKGMRAVSTRRIAIIFAGWAVTPLSAALFAALFYRLLP